MALLVLSALVFAPHILHGGFYLDDWGDAAGFRYPPGGQTFGNELSYFWEGFHYRPILVLYTPLKYFVFGTHMGWIIAWTVALGVLVAVLLYGVLRTLSVPWYHAWVIAALTIVYPWFDSIRLWGSANPPPVSIALALAGLWVALCALRGHTWRVHLIASAFYLVSILAYEITLPLIAVFGGLYVLRAGWRTGRVRWAMDLVVVVIGAVWDKTQTTRAVSGVSAALAHLKEIVTHGGEIAARTVQPLGANPRTGLALAVLAIVFAAGLVAWRWAPERADRSPGWGLREWLLLAGAGLLVAALGWVIFIPADPYYTPTIFGETNRVNALAGLGLVIAAYAALGIVGTLVARLFKRGAWALPVTLVLACLLGGAYVHVLARHIGLWDDAFRIETAAGERMQRQLPNLPPGSTVFTSNYPAYLTLGVPIYAVTWDLNGMIKLRYHDGTLAGYPLIEGEELVCDRGGVVLRGAEGTVAESPYGLAHFLNLGTGHHTAPNGRRECAAVVGSYAPGPLFLSTAY
ncbi:MAG TPA: hypothetical protein VLK56_01405 [Solirubrobacterales bacterium]|nr:hypothetical protein [Solirubrobacterales bacterium]